MSNVTYSIVNALKLVVSTWKTPNDWAYILGGLSWVGISMALYTLVDTLASKDLNLITYALIIDMDAYVSKNHIYKNHQIIMQAPQEQWDTSSHKMQMNDSNKKSQI